MFLLLGVDLAELVTFILEHLIEVFGTCCPILFVLMDEKWSHDELVESLKVVGASVLGLLLLASVMRELC